MRGLQRSFLLKHLMLQCLLICAAVFVVVMGHRLRIAETTTQELTAAAGLLIMSSFYLEVIVLTIMHAVRAFADDN